MAMAGLASFSTVSRSSRSCGVLQGFPQLVRGSVTPSRPLIHMLYCHQHVLAVLAQRSIQIGITQLRRLQHDLVVFAQRLGGASFQHGLAVPAQLLRHADVRHL